MQFAARNNRWPSADASGAVRGTKLPGIDAASPLQKTPALAATSISNRSASRPHSHPRLGSAAANDGSRETITRPPHGLSPNLPVWSPPAAIGVLLHSPFAVGLSTSRSTRSIKVRPSLCAQSCRPGPNIYVGKRLNPSGSLKPRPASAYSVYAAEWGALKLSPAESVPQQPPTLLDT